jgi:membrane fusion protein (multidrug efflux system)
MKGSELRAGMGPERGPRGCRGWSHWGVTLLAACAVCVGGAARASDARGVVEAVNQVTLASELGARVLQLPFRVGDAFEAGAVLVRFDCAIFEAQRDKVRADRAAAAARLDNVKKLEAVNSVGALDVTLADTALQQADAELRIAQLNADRCVIRAPWAGRVTQRLVSEHAGVRINQELLAIVSTEALEVTVVVPANWVRWLRPGLAFDMRIDETGTRHPATVVAVGSRIDPVSQTLTLRGRIRPDPRLLPGMSGSAVFSAR